MTTTITKSPIIKQGVNFPKYEIVESPKEIVINQEKEPTIFETVKLLLRASNILIRIVYGILKLFTWYNMSKTTSLGNRKFIAMLIGVVFMVLAGFGLDLEKLGVTETQVVEVIMGLIAIITALFFDRKQAEATQDAE